MEFEKQRIEKNDGKMYPSLCRNLHNTRQIDKEKPKDRNMEPIGLGKH